MKQKPHLSFWQIWNMCFGFLGIQFGFALQNANVSRIFQTLGAEIDDIPILWVAAPLTGLIVQPIIGYMSDRTWNRLGRRRPYFLVGAILASLALFVMPNSPALWVAAGMLWIMDASINISMEPFRAFVGDMLPEKQRTGGFAMQTFFIGTGAIVASALPWMMANWFDVSNTAPPGQIPDSVKWSFYLGGAVFFLAVAWTVFRTKEYSPEELAEFDAARPPEHVADDTALRAANKYRNGGLVWAAIGAAAWIWITAQGSGQTAVRSFRRLHRIRLLAVDYERYAERRQNEEWHVRDHARPVSHAESHAPTRCRAVLFVVQPVRDVDLWHFSGNELPLWRIRRDVCRL